LIHLKNNSTAHLDEAGRKRLLEGPAAIAELALASKARALQTFNYRRRKTEIGSKAVSKTMSIRMDRDNHEFLHAITKEEQTDLSQGCSGPGHSGRNLARC
jgi:hypothetical protein